MFQAIDGPRYLLESILSDGCAVDSASTVAAIFEALQGGPNLLQLRGILIRLFQGQARILVRDTFIAPITDAFASLAPGVVSCEVLLSEKLLLCGQEQDVVILRKA
ncbi:hypothetical protein SAMN05421819_1263 [Bryocella elongata]|uniref:Uncharacterized protein n=1 Tax=Bryocella elongata TaxID=863522 RepID=A0A1H5UXV3_9BACT|nr:hypothetical protein SAMN05421819_1263 [Bryocella elongata]